MFSFGRLRDAVCRVIATHDTPLSAAALVRLGVRWPSQSGQDAWVVETLHGLRGGYFVDVGASNGVVSSNTFALERYFNWTGVCIEANPVFLRTARRFRRGPIIDAVVWDEDDVDVPFRASGVCGGIVAPGLDNAADGLAAVLRRTRTLASILSEVNAPPVIDYLSIDVEGAEDHVLRVFPFDTYRVRVMTVERPSPALESRLIANGFRCVRRILSDEDKPVDSFFVHDGVSH